MENENNDNMIKVKELDHKMVKFQKDSKDAAHKVWYRLLFFAGFVRPGEILDFYFSPGNSLQNPGISK
jgi:hypothetical protein